MARIAANEDGIIRDIGRPLVAAARGGGIHDGVENKFAESKIFDFGASAER